MAKKALLMILDGWGIGKHGKGDVIYNTPTPYLDYLTAVSAHSQLQASGEDVGLPDGQMGNSEVGHLNIGAGRIVYQDLVKINRACKDGSIVENAYPVLDHAVLAEDEISVILIGLIDLRQIGDAPPRAVAARLVLIELVPRPVRRILTLPCALSVMRQRFALSLVIAEHIEVYAVGTGMAEDSVEYKADALRLSLFCKAGKILVGTEGRIDRHVIGRVVVVCRC